MKEKREERMNRDYMRDHRKNAIASLTRLVSDGEKSSMYRFLQERNAVEQVMAEANVEKRRRRGYAPGENLPAQRRVTIGEVQIGNKSQVCNYRRSGGFPRHFEEEFKERKALASENKFHLNENSSALLGVPKEITRSITKARTLERWNAAKEAEKQYLEETMTNRINQFAAEKAQRLRQGRRKCYEGCTHTY